MSQINTNETRNIAQDTFNKAQTNVIRSNDTLNKAYNLEKEIREFMSQNSTKPEDVKNLTKQIFAMKIDLDPNEVTEMANKIKEAANRLTNIQPVIKETQDLWRVNILKENAMNAKYGL